MQQATQKGGFGFELPAVNLGNGAYANPAYVDLTDLEASVDEIASQYVPQVLPH